MASGAVTSRLTRPDDDTEAPAARDPRSTAENHPHTIETRGTGPEDPVFPALARSPLLASLSLEAIRCIASYGKVTTYPNRTVLIQSGAQSISVHFVLSGRIKVFSTNHRGKEILLDIHGPGDCLGEGEWADSLASPVSAITLERSCLFALRRGDFVRVIRQYPEIAFNLSQHLGSRAARLTERLTSLALDSVYERIVKTLSSLAVERDGELAIERCPSQRDLAAIVGASREMVSRIIKDLSAGGYVGPCEDRFVIRKKLPARW